jgi:DNA-binding Lrp family transcriptional regulator/CheY-like chemotaxis protein
MYRPDALDRQIISLLQKDGRACYVALARALGVSEATARRRVERLIAEGVVEVVACVEPRRVGFQAEALVYLQVDLDKLTQIGQRLAAMPEVREVLYTSGAHDLVLRVALPSGDDLLPFLTQRVAPVPGIKATQTSHVLQVEKRLSDWQLTELPERAAPAGPSPSILLVDDDADFVAAARMVLEAAGYSVVTAGSGREALARLQEATPALVLLDLMMETPLAGLVVVRAVRSQPRLRGVPLLAISAIHSTEWASKLPPAAELPLDDFIDKPIEPRQLLEKVRRFIG